MFQHHMQVDLTAAAKFYGLKRVPPLVWDLPDGEYAGYSPRDGKIHIEPEFSEENFSWPTFKKRFASCGLTGISHIDAVRWALAHELWHAKQHEDDPQNITAAAARRMEDEEDQADFAYSLGLTKHDGAWVHDHLPVEVDADKHATQAYKLVKVTL